MVRIPPLLPLDIQGMAENRVGMVDHALGFGEDLFHLRDKNVGEGGVLARGFLG